MTFVVGLTGGIGSGKTLVSDHFAELDVPIIDTDIIARQIVRPGEPALAELSDAFGGHILKSNGELDRDALRKVAFAKMQNKRKLDAITHPAIRAKTINQIDEIKSMYCVVVVPLLKKGSPFVKMMDHIVVVTAEQKTRIKRVMQRNQLTQAEVVKIIATQASDEQRVELADDIITNDGSIQATLESVDALHLKLSELAAS